MQHNIKQPNFFIVGAPKSGTTAMYHFLRQHPEIFMPPEKELRFFCKDLYEKFPHLRHFYRPTNLKEYLSFFKGVQNEKRIGEATPIYLMSKLAPLEIKRFCPKAKILIMLRNPIEVLYSAYYQALYDGTEIIEDFEIAIKVDQKYRQNLAKKKDRYFVDCNYYEELVKFSEQIQRYFDVFGKENVHIIIFDDFKKDIHNIYRQTLTFLEVNPNFYPEFQVINPSKQVKIKWIRDFFINHPYLKDFFKPLIPKRFRTKLKKGITKLNTKTISRPPMPHSVKKFLQKKLKPEIDKLSNLLNRDLSSWYNDK